MSAHNRLMGRSPTALHPHDLYETPPVATRALMQAEKLPHRIWDPAAGKGALVNVLRAAGHNVLASDLIDYRIPKQTAGRDFLREQLPQGCDAIVTNPPFRMAQQFVEHALAIGCPRTYLLLRLSFLETPKRATILEGGQLARILVFRNRLPMMHRAGWEGPKASSAVTFAWFVWDRRHRGEPVLRRITWTASP